MGIDACIYVKTSDGKEPEFCDSLPSGCSIVVADEFAIEGATHEIENTWRYYGDGYERGCWPAIAHVLMALHACKNVDTDAVWYFGDTHGSDDPFTPERIHEMNAHYMRVGDRPYRA